MDSRTIIPFLLEALLVRLRSRLRGWSIPQLGDALSLPFLDGAQTQPLRMCRTNQRTPAQNPRRGAFGSNLLPMTLSTEINTSTPTLNQAPVPAKKDK